MTEMLNPSTVLSAVRIIAPEGFLTVSGVVTRLTPYPKIKPTVMFGEIRDESGDIEISFKCPIDKSPLAEGELATIRGSVALHHKNRLSLRLDGDCINHQAPKNKSQHLMNIRIERTKRKLAVFLEQLSLDKLAIIGTNIAIQDLKTALTEHYHSTNNVKAYKANFNSPDELLSIAKQAIKEGAKGIAFTRGGNDITLKHWDEPQFISELASLDCSIYTALGHSNQSFWVEKYSCDESFSTPTALGIGIAKAIQEVKNRQYLQSQLNQSLSELARSNEEINQLKKHTKTFKITLFIVLIMLCAVVLGYGFIM